MVGKKAAKKLIDRPAVLSEAKAQNSDAIGFPIVGLGASAGGLDAFEQFFRRVPPQSGMAFVLVSHLDPDHVSVLTEILQRSTTMPVVEARDQMAVTPNSVYIIPPNRNMAIFNGALQLSVPEEPRGHRMPIDGFLRSLAEDQGERAIGVILSGTGTDGTLGLHAILGAGGVSFVQDPSTAKYDGMPASAIQAGYATCVLPVEAMPEAMLAGIRVLDSRQDVTQAVESGLNRILMLLRSGIGHDFSQYKRSTIGRRIARRMSQHDIEDTETYARYIQEHPAELKSLFKQMLISVTSFFRDPEAFATLKTDILPQMLADKPEGYVFRAWVAGCATGEEAYSIAIVMREFMEETRKEFKVQIYSTDLDGDAIAAARAGVYPLNVVQDVLPEQLRRFFVKEEAGYRVKKEIREMVVFAVQNAIKDPPFTKLDMVSCRNLLIYLEPELQNRLILAFHFALKPGGVLFLSPSEIIASHPDLFVPVSRKWKVYRATHSGASIRSKRGSGLPSAAAGSTKTPEEPEKTATEATLAELTKRVLLQSHAPASVVTDLEGNILYVHGETGKYLRPAPGQATLNVVEMAHEGLQLDLRTAIHSVAVKGALALAREVSIRAKGDVQTVSFTVRPLHYPEAGQDVLLLSFQDVTRAAPDKPTRGKRLDGPAVARRVAELERDLAYTKENLQATIEEQQSSNEELKSTNEEMQSTNEELQSTNEELETSKEELQSLNEELVTVNNELQAKIEQLASMQNDMKNLLDNISVGAVFLDQNMVIRRFTRDATRVYRLVQSDVGRPLADIKSDLEGEGLLARAQVVLETLVPYEDEVCTAGDDWYLARIQPYRTLDNVIDGVVVTFVRLTEVKRAEEALREARELADGIVDTVREPLVVLDGELRVVFGSRSFYRHFRLAPEETVGHLVYELSDHQWDIPALRDLLETVLPRDQSFDGYAMEHDFPVIGRRKLLLNARRIVGSAGNKQLILLAMEMPIPSEMVGA